MEESNDEEEEDDIVGGSERTPNKAAPSSHGLVDEDHSNSDESGD